MFWVYKKKMRTLFLSQEWRTNWCTTKWSWWSMSSVFISWQMYWYYRWRWIENILFLSPEWQVDLYCWSSWRVSFVSLPRLADGLILSEWIKSEFCVFDIIKSISIVCLSPKWRMDWYFRSTEEWVLFFSPEWRMNWYYWSRWRVSFVSLPRGSDELILSVWTKYKYCLSLPRQWRMDWYYQSK